MSYTPSPMHLRRQYFPYIDGLRALAVLSVLVYHLNNQWLPGGFVGVDVFFVISGFVVSASVANCQGRGIGGFLIHFYARRIKRIFPALIVCLLVTAFLSALFIPEIWLSGINQQTGLYAFVGLSNFILADTGRDYFAPTTEFNPYTHTWSLGVEEQFYLVFPFLFFCWLSSRRGQRASLGLFAVGLVMSALIAAWQSVYSPTHAYFLTPSRFWELAAGVILYQAMALSPSVTARLSARTRAVIGAMALLCVMLSFFISTPNAFPMPGALLAVLGTMGVIASVHLREDVSLIHRALSSRLLTAIGKISYSLYLWHWPVFVLFRWTVGLESPATQVTAALLAFVFATLSYWLVETPVRTMRPARTAPHGITVAVGLLAIGGAWFLAKSLVDAQPKISLTSVSKTPEDWYPRGSDQIVGYQACTAGPEYSSAHDATLMLYVPRNCAQPRPLSPRTLYVIGDSHAMAYEGMFRQYAAAESMQIKAYVKSGCAFISLQPWNDDVECRRFARTILGELQDLKPGDVLFLPSLRLPRFASQWAFHGTAQAYDGMFGAEADKGRKQIVEETIETLRSFTDRGVLIVFEAPKPIFMAPPFRCTDWFNQNNPICAQGLTMSKAALEELRAPVVAALDSIKQQLPHVSIWDPFPVLCPSERCSAWDGGRPLFLDADHLSGHGNQVLLPSFSQHINDLQQSGHSQSAKVM